MLIRRHRLILCLYLNSWLTKNRKHREKVSNWNLNLNLNFRLNIYILLFDSVCTVDGKLVLILLIIKILTVKLGFLIITVPTSQPIENSG